MPIHDWTKVGAGIFHDFHHAWIEEIKRALNAGVLPNDYYALAEQYAAGFGPDVLALESTQPSDYEQEIPVETNGGNLLVAPPNVQLTDETDMGFYRRKQHAIVIRHVSGDHIVAFVEIVSPGNKSGRIALRSFVEKAAEILNNRIHLLILDLHRPGPRDPQGIHGRIWEEITGKEYTAPADKPLTLVAYESALTIRAYIEPTAINHTLIEMPLYLAPGAHVLVPLEETYQRAFAALPRRWRVVLEN